jgi:GAF domain-containing protein
MAPLQTTPVSEQQLRVTRCEVERWLALLNLAREVASQPTSEAILADLLEQAVTLIGAEAGRVYRWDEGRARLIQVRTSPGVTALHAELKVGEGATGLAAARGGPVIFNDYAHARQALPASIQDGIQAVLSVPIFFAGRLLGALTLFSRVPGARFNFVDAETLELLASVVAAALVGLERAQLLAATMMTRELAHQVNNALALVGGTLELLSVQRELPVELAAMVRSSHARIDEVVERLCHLQQLTRFETKRTPVGLALDVERSLEVSAEPAALLGTR